MRDFDHYNAKSVKEAVRLLGKEKGKAKLNAGGTDLLGLLKDMVTPDYPEAIINIKGISGLDYIREEKDCLKVGALVRLTTLAESPVVKAGYGLLAEAAQSVATPQIRNMCTLGGNLAQEVRCWYYRYPEQIGGTIKCLRKGGAVCNAVVGDNRYHSIFGSAALDTRPCVSGCPANTAIPTYLEKIKSGDFAEAARIFVDYNPLPAVTGRVCPTFCEPECKRGDFEEPVAVRCVERTLGDYMVDHAKEIYRAPASKSGKKVAIVGSGPAGLAAAYYLRRAGHSVTVYEKLTEAGGMLMYSIPGYRLPKAVVRKQIAALAAMGIAFECGTEVGRNIKVSDLKDRFDAVLVTTGAWKEKAQTIKGNAKIISGLEFLKKVNEGGATAPGRKIAVVGGGNVAIDVARTLVRLGAKPVVLYRRTEKEMPAFADEVAKAKEEGVAFRFLTLPTKADKAGQGAKLACVKMKLGPVDESGRRRPIPKEGSEFTITFDTVISAIGEDPDDTIVPQKARKNGAGYELAPGLYGAGDFKNGSSTVIEAIASGREAARAIESRVSGKEAPRPSVAAAAGFASAGYAEWSRVEVKEMEAGQRVKSLDLEDDPGIAAGDAQKEAARCFNCGCVAVHPSDIGAALVALDGTIVTSKRSIDAASFFSPNAMLPTVLDADEMITEISIPKTPAGTRQHYLKFTLRKPIDFAIVSVASAIAEKNGKCTDARITLGAVAPRPVRVHAAEAMLKGKAITEELAEQAAEAAVTGVKPLSKNAYKVQITKALVKRAILGEKE